MIFYWKRFNNQFSFRIYHFPYQSTFKISDTDEKELEAQEEQTADGEHEERESEPMDEEEENEEEEDPREGFTDEEEPDHPVLKELNQKLEEVRQSGSLDQMRNLHSELHARHVMARQEAVKQVANMI